MDAKNKKPSSIGDQVDDTRRHHLLIYGGYRNDIRCAGFPNTVDSKLLDLDVSDIRVLGSESGLICFESNNDLFIWNPLTNERHKVPQPGSQVEDNACLSFRFDHSENDYVICKVAREWGCWSSVESYSLNSNSWKSVGTYNFPFALLDHSESVTIHGRPHWLALRYGAEPDSNHVIVSFDLEDESFFDIPFPQNLLTKEYQGITMGVFDGCLCLFLNQGDCSDSDTEVWVMREYRKSESWKKEFTIDYYTGAVQPYTSTGCTGNDKFLVLKNLYGDLFLYDPVNNKEVESLFNGDEFDVVDDDHYSQSSYNVASYVETKVSAKNGAVFNRKRKSDCNKKQGKRVKRRPLRVAQW